MNAGVVSLQVGAVGALAYRGRELPSAIVKAPVDGPLHLGALGFDGDEHADHDNHGGPDMAACFYASENLAAFAEELGLSLPAGAFGENLTTRGLLDPDVHIGDVLALGGAVVQVSQPRGPCYKVAARHGRKDLPALMARGLKAGFHVRVLEPGVVATGDAIELIDRRSAISVAEVLRVEYRDRRDDAAIAAVLAVPELARQTADSLRVLQRRNALPVTDFGGD